MDGNEEVSCVSNITGFGSIEPPCPEGCYDVNSIADNITHNIIKRRCIQVPFGTYSPSNDDRLYKCPPGSYSKPGSSYCTYCPHGSYSFKESSGSCFECPPGTYSPAVGATECFLLCQTDLYDGPGSYRTTLYVVNETTNEKAIMCVPPNAEKEKISSLSPSPSTTILSNIPTIVSNLSEKPSPQGTFTQTS